MELISKFALLAVIMILTAGAASADGLKITELDVSVNYDEAYTYRVENRDRIDSVEVPIANGSKINADILPGSNVTFAIRVENTFKGEDPDLKGVFTRIIIEEIDDEADLEFESLDYDLEPGDDYRFDIEFTVPIDVDAGTYRVIIEAEGEDRNETLYSTEVDFRLEVKKQSHDIRITRAFLNPVIIDCDRKSKLTAEIANLGSNTENEVALELKMPNLGINSYEKGIALVSSDEASINEKTYEKILNIEVPSFFNAGTYPVYVNLYWKSFVLFDKKELQLIVKDCGPSEPKQEEQKSDQNGQNEEDIVVQQPKNDTGYTTTNGEFITVEGAPFLSSTSNIAVLTGGISVLVLGILVAIGYIRSRLVA